MSLSVVEFTAVRGIYNGIPEIQNAHPRCRAEILAALEGIVRGRVAGCDIALLVSGAAASELQRFPGRMDGAFELGVVGCAENFPEHRARLEA